MKKICFFIICLCILFSFSPIKIALANNQYYYTNNIEHLFTHCLIAYPEIAYKDGNTMKKYLDNDCITSNEFEAILKSLHKNNYVLVDIYSCFKIENGIAVKNKIKVPLGKKPLILSFDDVNYDTKKLGTGMVDKIILDKDGNIATQTKLPSGGTDISYNKEFVNILENFINKNPDFSINNARGCINLTGYDGILGYRTSHTNKTYREQEIENAKKVVNKLKELGWVFASHSYGHYHMNKITLQKFKQELELWENEVKPIVGKTSVYVYPYGEWQVYDNGKLCDKHILLNNYGFNLFCGVGMKTFFSYLPTKSNHKVLFMDRKCMDGYTLRSNSTELYKFFNPLEILDNARKNQ